MIAEFESRVAQPVQRPLPMLPAAHDDIVRFPASARPRLLFIIDAEEEFDWNAPFSRQSKSVRSMAAQAHAQRIFERYGVIPTYAVDYPVALQEDGFRPLLEFVQSGACDIGAQLHAWVTPPFEEALSEHNSFAGNLSPDLEHRKLEALTALLAQRFGTVPTLYRAGRYGAGFATPGILDQLGYKIDCSVLPGRSSVNLAPDYEGAPTSPYWLSGGRSILEIPVTIENVGIARSLGSQAYDALVSPVGRALKSPGIAARLRIFDRIRLTPEGSTIEEAKRLTRTLLADGHRIFVVSYHTPSLVPGHTPYVQSERDRGLFLRWLDGYCEFFMTEALGVPSTPEAVRQWALELEAADA